MDAGGAEPASLASLGRGLSPAVDVFRLVIHDGDRK